MVLKKILKICASAPDNFTLRKKNYSGGRNMSLINQTSKEVQIKIGRSEIHTNEDEFVENKTAYNRQLNYCISLLQKTKKKNTSPI